MTDLVMCNMAQILYHGLSHFFLNHPNCMPLFILDMVEIFYTMSWHKKRTFNISNLTAREIIQAINNI